MKNRPILAYTGRFQARHDQVVTSCNKNETVFLPGQFFRKGKETTWLSTMPPQRIFLLLSCIP